MAETAPDRSTPRRREPGRSAPHRLPPDHQPPIAEEIVLAAEELEVVLPSGDGVGPWSGSLRAGEQVLLLGPSGSGKSTLLRALAGAIPSHQRGRVTGSVQVGGVDPIAGGVLAVSGIVGHLGQDPTDGVCLPQVADDVALPLESRAVPGTQIGHRVLGALAAVGADDLAERSAVTLSGGELQRVSLAAALVARPRLLLLDEPTAMLDAAGVRAVRESVRAATADGTLATLLVEHRLDDWAGAEGIDGLPPRTIALDRSGHVLADGPTPEVLLRHGAALRAAGCWLPREIEEALSEQGPTDATDSTDPACSARSADVPPAAPSPHSAGEVLLSVRDAVLGREGSPVLTGVDLEMRAGQLLAVVGRNGAGKSTLLGALSRLDPPLSGSIDGAAAALALQRPTSQFVATDVLGELAASGAGPRQSAMLLEQLGLSAFARSSPYRLSGGQQRRLSIGAMLLTGRPVLLADEPGYGLDRASRDTVHLLLRAAAEEGRAVVMTTHDLRAVAEADAVAVIAEGRLHGPMTPAALLADDELLRRAGLTTGPGDGSLSTFGTPVSSTSAGSRSGEMPPAGSPSAGSPPADFPSAAPPRAWLARRNPTVLLGLLTALSIVGVALTDPAPLLCLYLLLGLAAMVGGRIGPVALLRAQLPIAVFALGVFTVNVLSRPGHEPWPELPLRITEEGIVLGTALALRALLIGLGALTVARATGPRETMVSLYQHARLPARYAYALLAGRRLLDDLPRRWEAIIRAHRLRLPLAADGGVPRLRPRALLGCAFALLVDALRSAELLAFALEIRGLGDGPRTCWRPVALGGVDAVLVLGVGAVVTAVLLLV